MSSPIGPVTEQYGTVTGSGNLRAKRAWRCIIYNDIFFFFFILGPLPVNVAEYERSAKNPLPRNAHDYYASGATDMITLRENRAAFSRLRLMPRVLIDVSKISTETTILGVKVASPICVAPTAMQKMAHPDGEVATSRASARCVMRQPSLQH